MILNMLGKRPHQIQRSTSMAQLRMPPGARARPSTSSSSAAAAAAAKEQYSFLSGPRARKAPSTHTKPHQETIMRLGAVLAEQQQPPHAAVSYMHSHAHDHIDDEHEHSLPPSYHTHAGHCKKPHDHISKTPPCPLPPSTASSLPTGRHAGAMSESFMDACYSCKKLLGHGKDIFMYRGDAAFCSEDCRLRQITYDEHRQNCSGTSTASQGTA